MRTFGIDKAAGNIIKSIGLFISDICVSMVTFALELINFVFNSSINAIKTEVAIRPEAFDGTMVETLRTISENTILPIAGLIITYVFAYEVYEMVLEKNRGGEMDLGNIIFLIIKTAVVISLTTNSFNIAMGFSDLGYWMIDKAAKETQTIEVKVNKDVTEKLVEFIKPVAYSKDKYLDGDLSNPIPLENLPEDSNVVNEKYHIDFRNGLALAVMMILMISLIASLVMCGIIYLVAWSRIVMIMVYISIAPLPMATLLNKNWLGSIGQNYIKNLMALMLQGFIMLLIVVIYNSLISRTALIISEELIKGEILSPFKALLLMMVSMKIAVKMLTSTHGISKSIVGAS